MAYLVLENGMAFEGKRIGASGDAAGEMVFTTGVVGYVETLTDPANAGLIVMQTFPVIGNYGVAAEDTESAYTPAGYVVRSLCDTPSNFRSGGSLEGFLAAKGIPGICGVDTRRLTAVLRQEGAMKAAIVDDPARAAFETKPVMLIPCANACFPAAQEKKTVLLWDVGAKRSLIAAMNARGWTVKRVPFGETTGEPADAVVIAGGPEGAAVPGEALAAVKALLGRMPVLAVGLGHVLAAQALGGSVEKMHIGHRGQNQPVFCTLDGRTYTTSQNHCLCVAADSLAPCGEMIYKNLNDGSCEGLLYPGLRCLSVQFDPDEGVFSQFETLMGGEK